jgi:hypothetical protein
LWTEHGIVPFYVKKYYDRIQIIFLLIAKMVNDAKTIFKHLDLSGPGMWSYW